ncbi:MAG: aminodeoxychorismate/anthranilate synthase component II [Psychrobacter sp.]|jgi:anthranilate synthase component 2|uniref:Anthranilate synthase component II n=1 Tax=Psychrobacter namhaensis TaxID=292734 RepID=A0ABW8L9A7_9GAMM|nr:aminodeoxychorismate/anthranilate synthase component II [Psychrobacter sp. UBA3068]MCD6252396.1 aminodeoxychorismate/anthranilate synthase component II [Psychrobacter sp.]|tara:strand:- start:965 stop:1612 length:648 start_codon:yes stop_codon:yes gene_type:complete
MNVLIIDNYDSFTFNLYQYIGEILQTMDGSKAANVIVKRNNEVTLAEVQAMNLDRIIISPGPGAPDDPAYFGICADVIETLGKTTPILGVCLGMQGIAHVFGGDVVRASVPMHGKVSAIRHNGEGIYQGLPQEVEIMRYHSLMVQADTLPDCLTVTAVVANDARTELSLAESALAGDEIMGLAHKDYPIQGVQFHPESFATEGAKRLLSNFLLQV